MLGHSVYQLIVMYAIAFDGHRWFNIENGLQPHAGCKTLGLTHMTIAFNTFVWMQLFNEVNSRRIDGELNVVEQLHKSTWFLLIMLFQIIGQVIIIQFGGDAFSLAEGGLDGVRGGKCRPVISPSAVCGVPRALHHRVKPHSVVESSS